MTHTFQSNGIEYLGVLLPEDLKGVHFNYYWIGKDNKIYGTSGQFDIDVSEILPPGNYELITLASEATEEMKSLMLKEEMYIVNPYGEQEPDIKYSDYYFEDGLSENMMTSIEQDFEERLSKWQFAESRTGVWVILKSATPAGV